MESTNNLDSEYSKRKVALSFKDKAWIFVGNWFILPGAVGLWMFFKFRKDGYISKSNSVCKLTIVSFVLFFVLALIVVIVRIGNR